MASRAAADIEIVRLRACDDRNAVTAAVDRIFFESSATQRFADAEAKARFRERWLGRYLTHHLEHAFLARDAGGQVLSYIIGAPDDPSRDRLFADLAFYRDFAPLCRAFPAQLHINVAADARDRGVGAALIEHFAAHMASCGASGLHAVTAQASRNRSFYARHGFVQEGSCLWNDHVVVFLGRRLGREGAPDV